MNFLSLIEAKRDGRELSSEAITEWVCHAATGKIPDYQAAALLMAIYFRGMTSRETHALTLAMRDSGEVLDFPEDTRPVVDKHSTGGVGDKVSLVLAPLLAALGFRVPMISGRGLGLTGGTLDKLESIPGFRTALKPQQIIAQVQSVGVAIVAQTDSMVPADRSLYALRDVTGTVPSIPLITASILSKKLAEGLEALVIDVKFGTAAFMQTVERARELARSMIALASTCQLRARALLTQMSAPLGRTAGNWLEVKEAVECLQGSGPSDVRELVLECAAHLLVLTRRAQDLADARARAAADLESGHALRRWEELLAAQGADLGAFYHKLKQDHTAPAVVELKAPRAGFISKCDARLIGEVIRDLGGGRLTRETAVQPDVGLDAMAKPGERIEAGQPLCRVHASNDSHAADAAERLRDAFLISDEVVKPAPLVAEVVES